MRVVHDGGGGANGHALRHGRAARCLQLRHLFDFDQAHAAIGIGLELGVIAEMRNHDPHAAGRLDDQRPFRDGYRLAVNGEADGIFG